MSGTSTMEVSTPVVPAAETRRRIALFGPASLFHDALRCLIESRSGASVHHVTDQSRLIETEGDLILYDVDLETVTDAELDHMTDLFGRLAPRPVLLIAGAVQADVLQRLLRDGVAGIVSKNASCDVLLEAIDAVSSGKVWLNRELLTQTWADTSHTSRRVCSQADKIAQLTQREREIVSVACSGITNRQAAERMRISEATVRHHLSSIFAKLGASNRAELIVFAFRHGLCEDGDRQHLC